MGNTGFDRRVELQRMTLSDFNEKRILGALSGGTYRAVHSHLYTFIEVLSVIFF
jgi:hypothetical protein